MLTIHVESGTYPRKFPEMSFLLTCLLSVPCMIAVVLLASPARLPAAPAQSIGFIKVTACDSATGGALDAQVLSRTERYPRETRTSSTSLPTYVGAVRGYPPGRRGIEIGAWGYRSQQVAASVTVNCTTLIQARLRPLLAPDESAGVVVVRALDEDGRYVSGYVLPRETSSAEELRPIEPIAYRSGETGEQCLKLRPGVYWIQFSRSVIDQDTYLVLADIAQDSTSLVTPRYRGRVEVYNYDLKADVTVHDDSILNLLSRMSFARLATRPGNIADENAIRIRAFKSWLSGTSLYAIKKTEHTVEGDPEHDYLLVSRGRCLAIHESIQDRRGGFGSGCNRIVVQEVTDLWLAYSARDSTGRSAWVRCDRQIPRNERLILRYEADGREYDL
jgi:hypothetical protein